jgi:formylglycine-generating enzyme required for sulfatase activity
VLSEFTRVLFYKVPSLVKIPAGTFVMGSPFSEVGRSSNVVGVRRDFELQHTVTLTKDFSMGKYEVTQGEYQALMGNNPSYFILFGRPNPALDIFPPIFSAAALGVLPFTYYGIDLTRPVEQVNWYDATSYCERLTATERAAGRLAPGWEYRLPTEAEWEYACRAGTSTTFHYGSELRSGLANFNGHREYPPGPGDPGHGYGADSFSHINPAGIFLAQTTPVGSYQPNGFGLYDMHGNVREWCLDWADNYPSGSVTDPQVVGPPAGLHEHVSRGGDWGSSALACRSAFREGFTYRPDLGFPTMGFRIVLAPVQ